MYQYIFYFTLVKIKSNLIEGTMLTMRSVLFQLFLSMGIKVKYIITLNIFNYSFILQ